VIYALGPATQPEFPANSSTAGYCDMLIFLCALGSAKHPIQQPPQRDKHVAYKGAPRWPERVRFCQGTGLRCGPYCRGGDETITSTR
jgi:hypothetical protein